MDKPEHPQLGKATYEKCYPVCQCIKCFLNDRITELEAEVEHLKKYKELKDYMGLPDEELFKEIQQLRSALERIAPCTCIHCTCGHIAEQALGEKE